MSITKTILASLFASVLMAGASAAATISLNTTPSGPFDVSDMFVVEATSSSDTPTFAGFEGTLVFDESILTLTNITINSAFTLPIVPGVLTSPASVAGAVLPGGDQTGETLLVSFTFTADAEGMTEIAFNNASLASSPTEFVFRGEASTMIQVGDDPVVGTPVIPLPASVLFLLTGLGGMTLISRRKAA